MKARLKNSTSLAKQGTCFAKTYALLCVQRQKKKQQETNAIQEREDRQKALARSNVSVLAEIPIKGPDSTASSSSNVYTYLSPNVDYSKPCFEIREEGHY